MSEPTVQQLDQSLEGLIEWERFALYLPGITEVNIAVIKRDKKDDVIGQKLFLYETWLKVYPRASWQDVVQALKKAEGYTLANAIKSKFLEQLQPEEKQVTGEIEGTCIERGRAINYSIESYIGNWELEWKASATDTATGIRGNARGCKNAEGAKEHAIRDLFERLPTEDTQHKAPVKRRGVISLPEESHSQSQNETANYRWYLARAAAEGTIKSKRTDMGLFGASATGKTSVLNLLLKRPPEKKYISSPVARPLKGYWLVASSHNWKEASKDILHSTIASFVQDLERKDFIEEENGRQCGSEDIDFKAPPTKVPKLSKDLEASINDLPAAEKVISILKSADKRESFENLHFVNVIDSGGQAPYIDIAPALFPYNSVNIVVIKLNEPLSSNVNFVHSFNGEMPKTDEIERQVRDITTEQLVAAIFSSKTKMQKPERKHCSSICDRSRFVIIATHYDVYCENVTKGLIDESLEDKNKKLKKTLQDYGDILVAKNDEDDILFPLNAMARNAEAEEIATNVRSLALRYYTESEVPVRWYFFQIAIEEKKALGENVIPFSKLLELGKKNELDEAEVKGALQYLHDLNVCLYYPDVVPNVVFASPQYLFEKLSEIIAISLGKSPPVPLPLGELRQLQKEATFERSLLKLLDCGFNEDLFSADDFLLLMEKLHIICPLPEPNVFFMPCLLESADDPLNLPYSTTVHVDPLLFTWKNTVPSGLLPFLVTWLKGKESGMKFDLAKHQQYRNKISLGCRSLGCIVVLFEYPTFIGILNTLTLENIAQSAEIRDIVLNGIRCIVKDFKWMKGVAYPEEGFLCKVSNCMLEYYHPCFSNDKQTLVTCSKYYYPDEMTERKLAWYGGRRIDASLQEIPNVKDAFELLKEKSSKWDEVGRALGIDINYREGLRKSDRNDGSRLEHVLDRWLETDKCPSWSKLMVTLKNKLKFEDIARKICTFNLT